MGSVVGAKGSMVMDDAVVGNCCTHCDIPSALARDFSNGLLADYISSPPLYFCEVESMKMNCCATAATSSWRTL